ncbi:hypothetical protein ARMGADRAFT_1025125 [Armillaria gallica]|uniref:Uncharacterized protein n=1 Tax=Armillaria gallica TaxID=47427 RepID=A0A2H3ENF4_ARMGA|nr:hypothetical protein ARMGADRAFT_1025125 [Armillaria gallica]
MIFGSSSLWVRHIGTTMHQCGEGMKKDATIVESTFPYLVWGSETISQPSGRLTTTVDVGKYEENGERRRDETRDGAGKGREWDGAGFVLILHWAGRITTFELKPAIEWGQTGTRPTSPDGRDGHPLRKIDVGVAAVSEPNAILTLLTYPVILPKTIAVGVSDDLMFSTKGHPFFAQLIHNLAMFDHSWFLDYPTVMFSTGLMFLSIQCAIWTSSHAAALSDPIRILPKSLYGKNAKDGEAPHSFFSHFYSSSWDADDTAFIGFLGHWGNRLMLAAVLVLVAGLVFMALPIRQRRQVMRLMGVLSSR